MNTSPTEILVKSDQQVSDALLRTVQRTVNTANRPRNIRTGCILGMAAVFGTLLYLDRGRDAATAYINRLNKEAEVAKGKAEIEAEIAKAKVEILRAEAEKIRAATRASLAGM